MNLIRTFANVVEDMHSHQVFVFIKRRAFI